MALIIRIRGSHDECVQTASTNRMEEPPTTRIQTQHGYNVVNRTLCEPKHEK
jgi:hypothetical protein